jgi:hypothetical protein
LEKIKKRFGNSEIIQLSLCPLLKDKIQDNKSMENNSNRDTVRAARIKRTAEICGVSTSHVQKVLRTDRTNEEVELVYFSIVDADNETDNKLKQAVRQLVPFN